MLGLTAFTLSWLAYDHYRPWSAFHAEMLALAGLGLLLGSFLFSKKASTALRLPYVGLGVAVAALLPWVQYLAGVSLFAGDALLVSMYLCAFLGALLMGHASAVQGDDHRRLQRGFFYSLGLAAFLSAVIGLLQWLDLQDVLGTYVVKLELGSRAAGNLGQANQLATLLLMGMMALTYMHQQQLVGRLGWSLAMAFTTLVLVLTGSRAGMLSVLLLLIFLLWKSRRQDIGLSAGMVWAWALGFVACHVLLPFAAGAVQLGEGRGIASLTYTHDRWVIWTQMAHGVWASPWVGYGWNQTPTAQMAGALVVPGTLPVTYAHNFILDMLAWNGVPLGLLITGLLGWWFATRLWRVRTASGVYAMAALLPVAVHSMVEFPFAYAYFLIAAGFLAGLAEASLVSMKTIKLNLTWSRGWLVLWVALGSYMAYEYFLIEEDFRVVRFENLRIGKTPVEYDVPNVWMLSHMGTMLKVARIQPTPGMSTETMAALRKVARRFPYGAINLRYALALGLNGDPEGATQEMRLIRGTYGEFYYQAAKTVLRDIEKDKYPELKLVQTP